MASVNNPVFMIEVSIVGLNTLVRSKMAATKVKILIHQLVGKLAMKVVRPVMDLFPMSVF